MSDKFTSATDKVCYGIGRQFGDQFASNPFKEINVEAIQAGLADAINKVASQVPEAELEAAFAEVNESLEAEKQAGAQSIIDEGIAYLEENKKREEIQVTDSGLQYEIITKGDGDVPAEANVIKAHYNGFLIDGTKFDSSYDRGEPLDIPVKGVIPGWTEALLLMPVGSKWKLHIPQELAYGLAGAGEIPPGAALIFDIELLDIVG
jgi:FKBP-type peptidyl-prolyl cis-trans isomerase FklB